MWKCPKCKAKCEDNFDSCWSCGIGCDVKPPDAAPASARQTRPESAETLDIAGTKNSSEKVATRLIGAVACVGLGIFLWSQSEIAWPAVKARTVQETDRFFSTPEEAILGMTFRENAQRREYEQRHEHDFCLYRFLPLIAFIIAAILPCNRHTYLHFSNRHIVTIKHYCGFEISKRWCPLTDFGAIVVRHICHSSEGLDTYTGSVGLKPVDGGAVLWVKSFPTTEDEVPRTAYDFARKLQEMTGLPGAPEGKFESETQYIKSMTMDCPNNLGRANEHQ